MRLMTVCDAAAAGIGRWFGPGGLRACATHEGPFTDRELDRLSSATPAVYVSIVGTHANANAGDEDFGAGSGDAGLHRQDLPADSDPYPPAEALAAPEVRAIGRARRMVELELLASIIARGGDGERAPFEADADPATRAIGPDRWAEAVASELLRLVPERTWGIEGVGPAAAVAMRNEFSEALADRGMALWTVGWRQPVTLGDPWPAAPTPTDPRVEFNRPADRSPLASLERGLYRPVLP